jgi:hypothetical protein
MLVPSHRKIWKAESQTLTAKYLNRTARAVGSSRSCTPTATYGDSSTMDISWTTYSQTVKTTVKMFENNVFTDAEQFANDVYNAFMDLYASIETAAVAHLDANKNTLQGNRTLNTWDGTNYIMKTSNANKDDYLNYMRTEMYADNYRKPLQHIHTVNLRALFERQRNQGPGNDENDAFQFYGMTHYDSLSITNGSDYFGTSYVVEQGGLAVLDFIPFLNRTGKKSEKGEIWTTFPDPFGMPFTWSLYITDGCADTTSTGGSTQDYQRIYEFSLDLSFNHAPLTPSGEYVINKYGLLLT